MYRTPSFWNLVAYRGSITYLWLTLPLQSWVSKLTSSSCSPSTIWALVLHPYLPALCIIFLFYCISFLLLTLAQKLFVFYTRYIFETYSYVEEYSIPWPCFFMHSAIHSKADQRSIESGIEREASRLQLIKWHIHLTEELDLIRRMYHRVRLMMFSPPLDESVEIFEGEFSVRWFEGGRGNALRVSMERATPFTAK
ncbi:uncharacterized protein BDR25DRAFT_354341 [Lindgomyces ingoldianus]|uniref:Uncharacterized protein n=1 Tax=Lindgomyces ingoldianus TaxID=673940 RepID=A0ACB6QZ67_9PLEO|nr:uncharacterized protein BDR25DRAFT_354341 [Lindgomyces ingoldianus]KAF2471835.1 hypothetical protein BDR25DRAFT_354341 [Lindgomyces ingoldianus]